MQTIRKYVFWDNYYESVAGYMEPERIKSLSKAHGDLRLMIANGIKVFQNREDYSYETWVDMNRKCPMTKR